MMLLQLVKGSIVIALSGDAYYIAGCTYIPRAPEDNHVETASGGRNGGEVTSVAKRNVVESVSVILKGTEAQILAQARAIEALFPTDDAQRYPDSERLYVQYRQEASGDVFRSEIFAGRVEIPFQALAPNLASGAMEISIIWKRRWFWEDTTLRAIPLTNSNGSLVSSGLTVWNHDDAGTGHDNWVDIAAANVTGSLPAGAIIQIGNGANALRTWKRLYVALNALSDPANFSHILEAEARLSGGTIQANAAASNGSEVTFTLSASSVTIQWSLSPTLLADAAGRMFRILAAVNGVTGTPSGTAQIAVRNGLGTVNLWKGDIVPMLSAPGLLDLGAVPIPPGGYSTAYGEVRLALVITGTGTWKIDYLQITPTDGIALVNGISPTGGNEYAVMDSIEEREYLLRSPSSQFPYVVASGQRIYLHPNRVQRLIILADSTEANVAIDDAFTVQVWYRPRRLTV